MAQRDFLTIIGALAERWRAAKALRAPLTATGVPAFLARRMAAGTDGQRTQRRQARVPGRPGSAAVERQAGQPGLSAVRDAVAQNIEAALAELRATPDSGAITRAEYDQQRDLLMRVLEMPTDRPLT